MKRKDTPPAPPGTCAARGARCDAEACCDHKSEDCYERDAGFARCLMRCDPSLPAFADWSCAFHPRPPPAPPSRLSRVKSKVADLLSKTNAYEDKLSAYVADSLGVQSPDLRDDIALIVAASVGAALCFCCSVCVCCVVWRRRRRRPTRLADETVSITAESRRADFYGDQL